MIDTKVRNPRQGQSIGYEALFVVIAELRYREVG
jgi:hypothetical protein